MLSLTRDFDVLKYKKTKEVKMSNTDYLFYYERDSFILLNNYRRSILERIDAIFTPNLVISVPLPNLSKNPFEWVLNYFKPSTILYLADWLTLNPDLVATFPLKNKDKKIVNSLFNFAKKFRTSYQVAKVFGFVPVRKRLWKFLCKNNKITLDYYLYLTYKHQMKFKNNYNGLYAHFTRHLDLDQEVKRIVDNYKIAKKIVSINDFNRD